MKYQKNKIIKKMIKNYIVTETNLSANNLNYQILDINL